MNKPKKQSTKNQPKGTIRIIGGKHRGRKLPVLMAEGLRPTTDRVKETVFNWLMPYINDSVCLDCFAGSGGLGFEALSRGAQSVTFIELNKAAAQLLQENKTLLRANNADIQQQSALTFLAGNATPYNLVFLDPPFRKNFVKQCADLLNNGWLADEAIIYVEQESENTANAMPQQWELLKEKKAGQVSYQLFQYHVK